MATHHGDCHCGAIGYEFRTALPPAQWSVRACQCSFCRSHEVVSTSDPAGRIDFVVREPLLLQRYRFGLRTAEFLLCRRCGSYVGAIIESAGKHFGIVNLRALTARPPGLAEVEPISYASEDAAARVARRAARWTPVSRVPAG